MVPLSSTRISVTLLWYLHSVFLYSLLGLFSESLSFEILWQISPRGLHLILINDVCYGMFDLYGIPIPFSVLNKSVRLFVVLGLYDFRISVFLCDQVGRYGPYGFTISSVLLRTYYGSLLGLRTFSRPCALHCLFGLDSMFINSMPEMSGLVIWVYVSCISC